MKLLFEFLEGIRDGVFKITESVRNIFTEFSTKFNEHTPWARGWGSDLVDNFVQGIKDNLYKVVTAASGMAGVVYDYLHFSKPDKGPLADFDTFGPDLVDLFTKGIDDNQYKLINSVRGMAANVSANIQGSPQLSGGVSGGGYVTTSAPINVIFEINGIKNINELDFNEMSSRAVDALVNQLDKHGIATNRAKGGAGWR